MQEWSSRGELRHSTATSVAGDSLLFLIIFCCILVVISAFKRPPADLRLLNLVVGLLCVAIVFASMRLQLWRRLADLSSPRTVAVAAIVLGLSAAFLITIYFRRVMPWHFPGQLPAHMPSAGRNWRNLVPNGSGDVLYATALTCVVWVITTLVRQSRLPGLAAPVTPSLRVIALDGEQNAERERLTGLGLREPVFAPFGEVTTAGQLTVDCRTLLAERVHHVLVTPDAWHRIDHVSLVELRASGIEVLSEVEFQERACRRVNPATLSRHGLVFSPGLQDGAVGRALRRAFDITFSLLLLALTMPLLLVTALAIRLDSPGPILYRQIRTGYLRKPFRILKFRSMRNDAEADGRAVWAQTGDPRVTRIGKIIRLCRIDELPQLLNVLAGDMSVIGPRPERPEFVAELARQIPHYDTRSCAKPGITGWAQVNYPYGASIEDARAKLEYDLYYIKHRNVWLDLRIIALTIRVVLRCQGAR